MNKINVMLVDGHQLVMEGIKQILENHGEFAVIAMIRDGGTVLSQIKKQTPDLILMELQLPGLGGIETCKAITQNYPHVKVVILTSCEVDMYISEAFRAGARSYLSKNITPQELLTALHSVHENSIWMPSSIARHVLQTLSQRRTREVGPLCCLTNKERDILSLAAEGRTTSDIARFLVISPKTVRNHLSHIYEKLGTQDRLQAVLYMKQLLANRSLQPSASA